MATLMDIIGTGSKEGLLRRNFAAEVTRTQSRSGSGARYLQDILGVNESFEDIESTSSNGSEERESE